MEGPPRSPIAAAGARGPVDRAPRRSADEIRHVETGATGLEAATSGDRPSESRYKRRVRKIPRINRIGNGVNGPRHARPDCSDRRKVSQPCDVPTTYR